MQFVPGQLYHVYNRGNNHQRVFFNRENYLFFLRKVRLHLLPYCEISAYCLMPNHFHFLLWVKENPPNENPSDGFEPSDEYALNQGLAILLRSYAQAINKQENRVGSLFQQKTKAKNLQGENQRYPFVCFQYIHQNPLRARIIEKMERWEFSSFCDYAGFRNGTLCNRRLAFQLLGVDSTRFYEDAYGVIDPGVLEGIW